VFVKICGLTSRAGVEAAIASGADAVGFVFAPSPRQLRPAVAAELCAGLPPSIVRVAVMHHPSPAAWGEVRDVFGPDWVQTDAADFAALELPPRCSALPVYRTGQTARLAVLPPRLLLEGAAGGQGARADWSEARALAARGCELILAGGLDPSNVGAAIEQVRPWGVDVSSGVETAPGQKDAGRMRDFVAYARAAEERLG
jgi:phosphoribosylanthranilate isomerase